MKFKGKRSRDQNNEGTRWILTSNLTNLKILNSR